MAKTANISLRTEPEVKQQAEKVYARFGLSLSDAITTFLYQSINVGGFPFELRQPAYNKETLDAFKEADDIISGKVKPHTTVACFLLPSLRTVAL